MDDKRLTDRDFNTLAEDMLARIEASLEAAVVATDADIDFELAAGGILEIECADGSKLIINRHAAAQEIWLAARAGGFHFRPQAGEWRDTRDNVELLTRLSELLSAQAGVRIVLG